MLRRGFLLHRISRVVLEKRRSCSPEKQSFSSGPIKTPRGKVLDQDSPKDEAIRQVVAVGASSLPPVISVAASLEDGSLEAADGVPAVPPTASDVAGCITPLDVPIVRGKLFLFPPVLEDVSTFAGLAKRSFGSKTTPRREAIELYRITCRELEHRISTACSVYFVRVAGLLGGLGGVCLG
jgi:hypothetical protein